MRSGENVDKATCLPEVLDATALHVNQQVWQKNFAMLKICFETNVSIVTVIKWSPHPLLDLGKVFLPGFSGQSDPIS